MINSESASKLLSVGLNILTFHHPIRTAIGLIVAVLVWCLTGAYPGIILALGMESNSYSRSTLSISGFMIIQIKTIYDGVTGRGVSEEVQSIINVIEKSPMTNVQKRLKYSALIEAQIERYSKSSKSEPEDTNVTE